MSLPRPPEPELQVAARLLAQGRPAEAVEQLAALVAEAPVYAAAHVLHATALEADGRPAEALGAWGRAAVLVPSSPLVHRERRRLLDAAEASDSDEPDAAPADDAPFEDDEPTEAYDVRAVDERFLLGEEDEDDESVDAGLRYGAPGEPADQAQLLPPETASAAPLPHVTAEAPGGAGWAVLDEDDDEALDEVDPADDPPDVAAPPARSVHPVADELDALISRLEDAPRIRPDPDFDGPAVSFDESGTDEVASETLAKIYEAQGQYAQAAQVYETLAAREPARAGDLLARAEAVRQKR